VAFGLAFPSWTVDMHQALTASRTSQERTKTGCCTQNTFKAGLGVTVNRQMRTVAVRVVA
jgi:hypothetical protein